MYNPNPNNNIRWLVKQKENRFDVPNKQQFDKFFPNRLSYSIYIILNWMTWHDTLYVSYTMLMLFSLAQPCL